MNSRTRWLGILLCVSTALSACGGGGGGGRGRPRPKGPPPAPKPEPDPVLENFELLGENPQWTPIKGLFKAYEKGRIEELANPMQSNLVTYVERPIIESKPVEEEQASVATTAAPKPGEEAELDPRRKFPLNQFQLIILLTGTSRPKAVVLSPKDERYELSRGDPIGEEGGRVRAITQYAMLVAMPGQTKLKKVSLRPPLAGVEQLKSQSKPERANF